MPTTSLVMLKLSLRPQAGIAKLSVAQAPGHGKPSIMAWTAYDLGHGFEWLENCTVHGHCALPQDLFFHLLHCSQLSILPPQNKVRDKHKAGKAWGS
jgi:hypothetical protein